MLEEGPVRNPHSGSAEIEVSFDIELTAVGEAGVAGPYQVEIICGVCGDHNPMVNVLGLRNIADDGNEWTLSVQYEHYISRDRDSLE